MRFRRVAASAGAVAIALVFFLARRHVNMPKRIASSPAPEWVMEHSVSGAHRGDRSGKFHRAVRIYPWRLSLCLDGASIVLSVIALATFRGNPLPAGVLVLVAFALSSFVLRGPRQRNYQVIIGITIILVFVQFTGVIFATALGMLNSIDPISLIELTVFGICGFGIALILVVTWVRGWPFAEPLAAGLIAISLGALCLPGVRAFTETLQFPQVNGAALLFATGSQAQEVSLIVITDPLRPPPTPEDFDIESSGSHLIHWALLLVGDARLKRIETSPHVERRDLFVGGSQIVVPVPAPAQLFFGIVNSSSMSTVTGNSVGRFVNSTSDRLAVSLPAYGQGLLSFVSSDVRQTIASALGGSPTLRDVGAFKLFLSGGNLTGLESVSQVSPPLTPNAELPKSIQWSDALRLSPTYVITDQNALDTTSNILFVFAILLGVAGAGLLASLQGIIHAFSSQKMKGTAPS